MSTLPTNGSSSDLSPKSEPRAGQWYSREVASAVGDFGYPGSLSTTFDGSSSRATYGHIGDLDPALIHRPPYLDVQTVKTNLTIDQAAKLEGQSHCLLLVEPVLLPNLGHTGVARETLPADRPLFYPNGKKNCGLGATVRNALYESKPINPKGAEALGRQQQRGLASSNSQQLYHNHASRESDFRQQQGPPSDWAGSSAYYTLSSESSSCCNSARGQHVIRKRGDEASVMAAIPSGQGGRFPTDVWGTPPGEGWGGFHNPTGNSNRRRRKKNIAGASGAGGISTMRRQSPGSVSGSILDRRLTRYPGRQGGEHFSSEESLLAGRKAEFIRAQQQQLPQQQQQQQEGEIRHPRGDIDNEDNSMPIEQNSAEGGQCATVDLQERPNPSSRTHNGYEGCSEASRCNRKSPSTTMSDRTMSGQVTRGWDGIDRVAGRDSEWLAERRAADREAKEVLSAMKNNTARLHFLVGGG